MFQDNYHSRAFLLYSPDSQGARYWVFDLECEKFTDKCGPNDITKILNQKNNWVIFFDAKNFLKKFPAKNILAKIICLNTCFKLCEGNIENNFSYQNFSLENFQNICEQSIEKIFRTIEKNNLKNLCKLECELIPSVLRLEQNGFPFKKNRWQNYLQKFFEQNEIQKKFLQNNLKSDQGFALFGPEPIDLNNPSVLKKSLEKTLGEKISSTSQKVLKNHSHPVVKALLAYRESARMLSTYGENFLLHIENDRIFAKFTPLGSASGRIKCESPNLQALPQTKEFVSCIQANDDRTLLRFDYSGFELRILAALSQDKNLLAIFEQEKDIHSTVAQSIFKVPVSKDENAHLRSHAKILNFGIIYGMGENALASQLKTTPDKANELLNKYFSHFVGVRDFLRALEKKAAQKNCVNTPLGRFLSFEKNTFDNTAQKNRLARNMPIQGCGADIAKLAVVKIDQALLPLNDAQLVNMIHDELVVECKKSSEDATKKIVTQKMRDAFIQILPNICAEVSAK